ncbi:radical SAM protein [Aliidongia dinghuensis]|uniref:Radical SAM protein n=1 Tax=Aliidongia dinghuensis TaxID=1867774 RepID=A0A8J3E3D7_9PROT|nr:PA0069 family radical SAM protein [Aliidongia dinghuensis]GGF18174.1 radical SAM protein [Aliidongia dinghuensis]
MDPASPQGPRKGRGSLSNAVGRFEGYDRVEVDDGWGSADEPALPLATTLTEDTTRTIIARNKSPDVPFDRSINMYRGCEHGCVYCFARPTHAYLGLSPGLDFESRLFYKPRAAELLVQELSAAGYRCLPMALGTNTDPYQPIERELQLTRHILEVLRDFNHPVSIVTKGALVQRDIDILGPMAVKRQAKVAISITTLDRALARRMEPRAATPERRLETVRALADAGIPVGVMAAPMIPGLNDQELETILEAAKDAGAGTAGYVSLRLPLEIKDLFAEWLEAQVPLRAKHVLALVRDIRGGKLNSAEFGDRMRGGGAYADLLAQRFKLATRRLGLNQTRELGGLDCSQFRRPPRAGDQLSLF